MLPLWFGSAIAFVYGTVVGSFLNVCIYRWPADGSVMKPSHSYCPKCNNRLRAADLVPLLSFLLLGRKCRYCGEPISWRYFIIELITGIVFVATYLRYGFGIDFYPYVLFLSALIVAFVVDMEQFIIPDQVSIAGIVLGVGKDIAHVVASGSRYLVHIPIPFTDFEIPMLPCVIGFVVCGGLFYLIAWVSFYAFRPKDEADLEEYEGAMGGGDVKLAAATGAVLGAVPALASFLIAVVLGTLFGVALVVAKALAARKKMPWRTEIPFGPYMVLGSVVVIFAYPQLQALWGLWVKLITPG